MKQHLIIAILAAALLAGCAEDSSMPQATGKGTVRAINAIPGSPDISFLIEERVIDSVRYKATTTTTDWDDLSYTFHFDVTLEGDTSPTRVASQPLNVGKDMDYTFIIGGAIAAPDISLIDAADREWGGSETVFEVRLAHLAASLGDVDVYLADAAVAPMVGAEIATVAPNEVSAIIEVTAADLVMTITPTGVPGTILFQSDTLSYASQNSLLVSFFDGDENDIAPVTVRQINTTNGAVGPLFDARFPPTYRFIHASRAMPTSDIYTDDPLTVPIVSSHMYRDVTAPIDMPTGAVPLTYVDSSNMSVMPIDADVTVSPGSKIDAYAITNFADDVILVLSNSDRRSVSTFARLILMNAAAGRETVDVYLVETGTSIDEVGPTLFGFRLGSTPVNFPLLPRSYDIYVTDNNEKTPLAGPILFDVTAGEVFEAVLYDNVDPNIVDFEFIP